MEPLDDETLRAWLREDAPFGNLTTRSLGVGDEPARLRFGARRVMRVAAVETAGGIATEAARIDRLGLAVRPLLAPAGGVTADNAVAYAAAGADVKVVISPAG